MPKIIDRTTNGSYRVYSLKEWYSMINLMWLGCGLIVVFILLASFFFYGYLLLTNILRFDTIDKFGFELYLSNIANFHSAPMCYYHTETSHIYFGGNSSILVFEKPFEQIDGLEADELYGFSLDNLDENYGNRAIYSIKTPTMFKYSGYLVRKYEYEDDYNKFEPSLTWYAVSIKTKNGFENGYTLTNPSNHAFGIIINEELTKSDRLDESFTRDFDIKEKISGNRYRLRFGQNCELKISERT